MTARKIPALAAVGMMAMLFAAETSAQSVARDYGILTDAAGDTPMGRSLQDNTLQPVYVNDVLFFPYVLQTGNGFAEIKITDDAYVRVNRFSTILVRTRNSWAFNKTVLVYVLDGRVIIDQNNAKKPVFFAATPVSPLVVLEASFCRHVPGMYDFSALSLEHSVVLAALRGQAEVKFFGIREDKFTENEKRLVKNKFVVQNGQCLTYSYNRSRSEDTFTLQNSCAESESDAFSNYNQERIKARQ